MTGFCTGQIRSVHCAFNIHNHKAMSYSDKLFDLEIEMVDKIREHINHMDNGERFEFAENAKNLPKSPSGIVLGVVNLDGEPLYIVKCIIKDKVVITYIDVQTDYLDIQEVAIVSDLLGV